jgi:photosystem II stability/assembly factor-like uncharacterized protein
MISLTTDLCALDKNIALALTGQGVVLRTENAGDSWQIVLTQASTLRSCNFSPSCDFGVVVGDHGACFMTIDSGKTWTKSDVGTLNFNLKAVNVFSESRIWASSYGTNFSTKDGGKTWSKVGLSTSSQANRSVSRFIELGSSTIGVGYPGLIVSTTDSGASWSYSTLGIDGLQGASDVFVLDSETYIAVGTSGWISRSTNAGLTWSLKPANSNFDMYSVHFWDSIAGVAIGDPICLLTSDGGLNWDAREPFSLYYPYTQLVPIDDQSCVILSDTVLWLSHDRLQTLQEKKYNSKLLYFGFGDLAVRSKTHWLNAARYATWTTDTTISPHTILLSTNDAGTTWEVIKEFKDIRLGALYFITDSIGFLAGYRANIWRTTDAGQTWVNVLSDPREASIISLSFVDDRFGYAAGQGGQIWFTSNGGITWIRDSVLDHKPQSQERFSYLSRVVWADSNTVLITGMMGILKKRIDRAASTKGVERGNAFSDLTLEAISNPVSDRLKLRVFGLHQEYEGLFHLELFDVAGRPVMDLTNEMLAHRVVSWSYFDVDVNSLPVGTYLLKLSNGERSYVKKIVVLR